VARQRRGVALYGYGARQGNDGALEASSTPVTDMTRMTRPVTTPTARCSQKMLWRSCTPCLSPVLPGVAPGGISLVAFDVWHAYTSPSHGVGLLACCLKRRRSFSVAGRSGAGVMVAHFNANRTGSMTQTATGHWPCLAGSNRHCLTASIAASRDPDARQSARPGRPRPSLCHSHKFSAALCLRALPSRGLWVARFDLIPAQRTGETAAAS